MTIFTALILYIGLMSTVYHFLVLGYVVGQNQNLTGWADYPPAVFKAMLFNNITKKMRSLVWRWWASIGSLLVAILFLIGVDQGWFG